MRFLLFVFLCYFVYSSDCTKPTTPYANLDDAVDACTQLTNGPEANAEVVYKCRGEKAPTGTFQDLVDAFDNCIDEASPSDDGKSVYTCKQL